MIKESNAFKHFWKYIYNQIDKQSQVVLRILFGYVYFN